jgi:hypothetical protein
MMGQAAGVSVDQQVHIWVNERLTTACSLQWKQKRSSQREKNAIQLDQYWSLIR